MSNLNKNVMKVFIYVGVILSTVVTAVMFIPAFIWGVCNRIKVKDVFHIYWIEGYGEQLSHYLEELEEA